MEKIQTEYARDILKHLELEDESVALYNDKMKTTEFLDALLENSFYMDAVTLLAHTLPRREAVWWGCICAKKHSESVNDELYNQTLTATEKWVYEPSEKNRRVAEFFAEKSAYKTAASWAAAAAFWSGESIMPEGEPKIAPDPYLYSHAVKGCIITCVGMDDGQSVEDKYKDYLKHGLNIANGGNG